MRSTNEDAFLVDDELGLYVVADGMGGHAAGEVASREAIEVVFGVVQKRVKGLAELHSPLVEEDARAAYRLLETAVQGAAYHVHALGSLDRTRKGMGTTLTGLLVVGSYAVMAHVGDSRIYRLRGDHAHALTEDHTLVARQVAAGVITSEEAKTSKHRNIISRAVGLTDYVEVDTGLISLERGDRFLLCTDGVYGSLSTDDITFAMLLEPAKAVSRLVALANDRGGEDNITAVIVEVG